MIALFFEHGHYDSHEQFFLGVFSSKEKAEEVKCRHSGNRMFVEGGTDDGVFLFVPVDLDRDMYEHM